MKSILETFKECAEHVNDTFGDADASERLRATLGLVDLMARNTADERNHERWEKSQPKMMAGSE